MTPVVLGALALVLAGPVPWLLLRLPWLRRTPAAALLLWQSVALAAVLAALGAGVSLATALARDGRVDDLLGTPVATVVAALVALLTLTVAGRLLLSGHRVGTELRALRRRHREQVDLVASREGDGLHILEHPLPVAWCLPGMRGRRIVVSEGLLRALPAEQAAAVVAHEREHLRSRHDLVLEAFTVLHRAFPGWVASAPALREAALLVEVLADRAARREYGARALAGALVAVSTAGTPEGSLGVAGEGSDLLVRVRLAGEDRPRRVQAALLVLTAAGLLALPTALVVWPWAADLLAA
ncbi:M56 family metallopeptidase [Nocardioides rotundus]|uniref:M56 family metallopeptidase n=1 Tax=Nocardioides rotundus TaxID=1774216 RepID=UPI001CBBD70E|nr:M56 family metallopeptidase [Nocardioides rotundus]UAL31207.1 M56 family metallopeptidase [Nocardioides rotundus]